MSSQTSNHVAALLAALASFPRQATADDAATGGGDRLNVLHIISDNIRPALGAYGHPDVQTPHIDAFARKNGSTVFANAHCQEAWCSPSRNSFLSGRRPDTTQAWNFLNSFRDTDAPTATITALPEMFRNNGYYTMSVGKVYHPHLPPDSDNANSWSTPALTPTKIQCRNPNRPLHHNRLMSCTIDLAGSVDHKASNEMLGLLDTHVKTNPTRKFYAAIGYQSNRLDWSYPAEFAKQYDPANFTLLGDSLASKNMISELEWFRQVEVNQFVDLRPPLSYTQAMAEAFRRKQLLAYYSAASHVDREAQRMFDWLETNKLDQETVTIFHADHGQNLGELNLWSMMTCLDISSRVPLIIHSPRHAATAPAVYTATPVELVDVMPTLAGLAGIPTPTKDAVPLAGTDLSPIMAGQPVSKPYAFTQITRCFDCAEAYSNPFCNGLDPSDVGKFAVACAKTPRVNFDYMGMSIRSTEWRYTAFCGWNGTALKADLNNCTAFELFDHRAQGTSATQPLFRPAAEQENVYETNKDSEIVQVLHQALFDQFST